MPQVIDLKNKEVAERSNVEKKEGNPKTKFQEEWEKAIPIEEAREHLLKTARGLWKK